MVGACDAVPTRTSSNFLDRDRAPTHELFHKFLGRMRIIDLSGVRWPVKCVLEKPDSAIDRLRGDGVIERWRCAWPHKPHRDAAVVYVGQQPKPL